MIEKLFEIDHSLFFFINRSLANPVTDFIMPIITNDLLLRLLFAIAAVILFVKGGKRFIWIITFAVIAIVVCDQSSSAWLKPFFARPRPCRLMEVHLLINCGPGYAFPSSHAANLFGQALFWGLLFRKYLPHLLSFAFLVGLSRVFVGVHYPLDVVGGAILGSMEGAAVAAVFRTFDQKGWLKPNPRITT